MVRGLGGYLAENWGAPFILGFVVLLVISAAELSLGSAGQANDVAVYAFYFLVIGVGLQLASYVKYGEAKPGPATYKPLPAPLPRRRIPPMLKTMLAVAAVVWMMAGAAFVFRLVEPIPVGVTHASGAPLSIRVSFVRSTKEPDGSTVSAFGVDAFGGSQPYNFTARWADGFLQGDPEGIFSRTFSANQSAVVAAVAFVVDAKGTGANLSVSVPAPGTE